MEVSTRENGHIVVDVLERPKPQQHAEAELYGLLDEVNKVIGQGRVLVLTGRIS